MRTLWRWLVVVALGSCSSSDGTRAPDDAQEPESCDLAAYTRWLAGEDAIDCGSLTGRSDGAAKLDVADCTVAAHESADPFFSLSTGIDAEGDDIGLVGTGGELFTLRQAGEGAPIRRRNCVSVTVEMPDGFDGAFLSCDAEPASDDQIVCED